MNLFLVFDFTNFVGRFHPLFVHLPIGFLLLGILMEWYQRFRKNEKLSNLISYTWLLGGLGGALAAFCGWWLGESGLYFEDDLFLHRWIGIAIVVLAFIGWWIKKTPKKYPNIIHHCVNILLIAILTFEGHLGGNLTHGEAYLFEYAPEGIRNMVLGEKERAVDLSTADSVIVYNDLVKPIFQEKCFACHNNKVKRGGLNMAFKDSLLAGGDGESVLLANNAQESELFRRITLPNNNLKFMPPVGNPLTYDEIKIIEWWIEQGASFDKLVVDVNVAEDIKPALIRKYNLDTSPRPYYEMVSIAPMDSIQLEALEEKGFTVNVLGGKNPLLDVKYSGKELTNELLKSLEPAAKHITWLSLGKTNISDEGLLIIAKFENLTRLQLENTKISDKGVKAISNLKHLEALNLYGTEVTNDCLSDIGKMEGLKRVYLWATKVNASDAKSLEESKEGLQVIIGQG
ncbi:hypothetical protein PP182_18430 [Maribacter sp. PR1]|uniref:C-type cytochrome domain-containing protein n=1 Tax=Maribacter cobaltidurans TaxID=1178778 RepID=A0ABU7IYI8_9FLAO|nr:MULTISPECIES: c-type cytochrome domain-containing protein [Maribacter]MDC6390670.1 hypothetical protein [Maribacter sp. PR1]MEE1978062.1 c-type cytochrome domain-containing protein [Maribacter cobaltidurans]